VNQRDEVRFSSSARSEIEERKDNMRALPRAFKCARYDTGWPLPMHSHETDIVPYREDFADAFDQLNRAWLEEHGLLEADDLPYLEDPRGRIIDHGGAVLCALSDGTVVGTVALIRLAPVLFELAKLAVAPGTRGRGLGRRLTLAAIDLARSLGARRIVLSSSSRLTAALRLYESLGFQSSAPAPGAVIYRTADVHMALDLQEPVCGE
jgi:ribosomal protein S18 acetylase RimI-like enzyme